MKRFRDGLEILKVQLPLVTNDPNPLALVYNRDRSVRVHIAASKCANIPKDPKQFWWGKFGQQITTLTWGRLFEWIIKAGFCCVGLLSLVFLEGLS